MSRRRWEVTDGDLILFIIAWVCFCTGHPFWALLFFIWWL